jgi:hypothetical protein
LMNPASWDIGQPFQLALAPRKDNLWRCRSSTSNDIDSFRDRDPNERGRGVMPRPFSREEEEHQADESLSGRQAQRLVPERESTVPINQAWKTLMTLGLLFLP